MEEIISNKIYRISIIEKEKNVMKFMEVTIPKDKIAAAKTNKEKHDMLKKAVVDAVVKIMTNENMRQLLEL